MMARGGETRRAHLLALLHRYAPADSRESEHHRRIVSLVAGAPDPFSRRAFDPGHVTASAFILSPERDALLLVFHSKLARWLQPGGHVDPDDADVAAAARREAHEEAGVDALNALEPNAIFDLDVHPIPARKKEPAHEHFDVRLLFAAQDRAVVAASDALDVRWFSFDAVEAADADPSVIRALAKIRRAEDLQRRDP